MYAIRSYYAPLHTAAQEGRRGVAELLIARGAVVDARDNNRLTPLHLAVFDGHADIVQMLIEHHAAVNAKGLAGTTSLHMAAGMGREALVKLLIANGADINARDERGLVITSYSIHYTKLYERLARATKVILVGEIILVIVA